MINGSFIFGMDRDDESVFDRTVDWALDKSIETATFHILTPYPGTALYDRMCRQGRLLSTNWNRYDTRHAVFRPARMTAALLEAGYWSAYRRFYSWSSVFQSVAGQASVKAALRHLAYTVGWKKMAGFWSVLIRRRNVQSMVPVLERLLNVRERKGAASAIQGNRIWKKTMAESHRVREQTQWACVARARVPLSQGGRCRGSS